MNQEFEGAVQRWDTTAPDITMCYTIHYGQHILDGLVQNLLSTPPAGPKSVHYSPLRTLAKFKIHLLCFTYY